MLRKEDKRNFKRYNSASECEVTFPSGAYKGKVVDYSDGACIFIENPPDVDKGMEVNVRIFNHYLEFKGEVAWVVKTENTVRAGIRRVDNFRGNLRDFMVMDLLTGMNWSAKTGVLEIRSGATVKKVFIEKGDLIFSASNDKDDRLGEHLLKRGKITLTEFEKASYLTMTTGKKLGEILVELSCMTPEGLVKAIRHHIEDIIISLFPLEAGEFEFKEKPIHLDKTITLHSSTANIIYQGIKKISSFVFIKKICPSIDDILNSSRDPLRMYQSLSIEDADKKILAYVNGVYPLKTILSLSPSSNFETLKTIIAFMTIGLINVKKQDEAPAEFPVDEVFSMPEAPPDYVEKIDRVCNKCEHHEHYEILGVTQDASIDDIRKGYSRLIKQFHPDRHFSFHSHDVKDKLLKIVSRATEAYEFLSDPDKRVIRKDPESSDIFEMPPAPEEPSGIEETYVHDPLLGIGHGPSEELEKEESSVNFYNPLMADGVQAENDISVPLHHFESEGTDLSLDNTEMGQSTDSLNDEPAEQATETSEEKHKKEPERIELPDEIMLPAGTEETPFAVTEGEEEKSAPVYELDRDIFESNRYENESDVSTGSLEDEPVTETGETSEEKHKKEPEPLELAEEIMLPESGEEPVLEETAERGEEEPVPEHDRAAEEISEADEQDDVSVIAHDARETVRSRKKWIYIPGILIIIILLGLAIPLVEDDNKEVSPGGASDTKGLTSFREDVFKEILHK